MNFSRTLKNRITGTLLAVACFVFIGGAVGIGWLRYNEEKEDVIRIMQAQVEIAQSLIRAQILNHDARLRKISKELTVKDNKAVLDGIRIHLRPYEHSDIYYVVNSKGNIVLISDEFKNYLGYDPAHMDKVFQDQKITGVFTSIFSKKTVVALKYRLNDDLTLVYERDIHNILPVLEHMEKGRILKAQQLFILSTDGIIVYNSNPSPDKNTQTQSFNITDIKPAGWPGVISYNLNDVKYYACTEDLKLPLGWTVYLQIPSKLVVSTITWGIAFHLFGLLFILLTVIFSLQFALNRFFSKPVGDIVKSLENYDPTQEITPLPIVKDYDVHEFSQIAAAVNQMAEDVSRSNRFLRDSEEHVRLLLNSTAEAIYGLDLNGNCTFCNAAFLKLLRYHNEKDLLGKNIHDLIHHTRADGTRYPADECVIIKSILEGRQEYSESDLFHRSDGTRFSAQYWSHPTRINGEVNGAVITFLDITERKKADEERNTAVERFRILVDSLDAVVYVADMTTYEILFINKSGLETWPGSIGKKCWQVLQVGQPGPCSHCSNDKLLDDEGKPNGICIRELKNSVNNRWYECRDQAIRWTDGRMVRMAIGTDITRRKNDEIEQEKLKSRIHQSQKMESIGTLAGGIAHDFNNILSAILGFSELARRDKDNPENLLSDLNEVVSSANRAKDLVRQILTFSRRTEQKKQLLQVSLVVKETLKLLRSSIPTTIDMQENIFSNSTAFADPTQIHQITMNLCTNAYYAMRETGGVMLVTIDDITVEAEDELTLSGIEPDRYIHLSVSDNGCGMDETTIENIFEPYFTTKEAGEGTGLGLAVVHGIIESHNGYITVKSALGAGTTFDIYLPLVEKEADDFPLDSKGNVLKGGNERIMFVDDEEKIANMATKLLSGFGYQVTTFLNAQQALYEFKKSPDSFDLVITDMTMPYMTGANLAQCLLEVKPTLPIILCTGHSDIINQDKAMAMGISEYCEKPLSLEKMLDVTRKTLDRSKSKNARVLFVDDNGSNVELGKVMLETIGCVFTGMSDSAEALALFNNDPSAFDIVITDQVMPGLDGFELAKQMLTVRPELTICMLTGNESKSDRDKAEASGIREFLTKPMNMDEISRIIGSCV